MKRALFDTMAVLPFASGSVTERMSYESAVLALTVEAGKTAVVKVEHSDTAEGTFDAVKDTRLFIDNPVDKDGNALIKNVAAVDVVYNLDIDLIGCKEFVKVTVTDGTVAALALGDATDHPVDASKIAVTAAKAPSGGGSGGKS